MWSIKRRRKEALIIALCLLIVGLAGCGSGTGRHGDDATTVSPSHAYAVPQTHAGTMHLLNITTANAASFSVTSIEMSVTPTAISTWKCDASIQVVYNALFHVVSGPNGGTIVFSYTVNNGRSQTFEKLTILPGQHQSNFVFTWQGSLPRDHTYPGPGGVAVTSPNALVSPMVSPIGRCR